MSEQFVWSSARRESVRVKITLDGPSGAGKTVAALMLAYGLCGDWGRILVVDTENRRALYTVGQVYNGVRVGSFLHCPFGPPYSPHRMNSILAQAAQAADVDVVIFDSLSKEWEGVGGTLDLVETVGGNSANKFTAWKGPGDAHRQFIDAVQACPKHVICTMRAKVKYDLQPVEKNGKTVTMPVKRGMEPIQRANTEYEFDVAWSIRHEDHAAAVSKDNTNLFGADEPGPITPEHGRRIVEWSNGAECQVGGAHWVSVRMRQLETYQGTTDGLLALWTPIFHVFSSIASEDRDRLTKAKNDAKARIGA